MIMARAKRWQRVPPTGIVHRVRHMIIGSRTTFAFVMGNVIDFLSNDVGRVKFELIVTFDPHVKVSMFHTRMKLVQGVARNRFLPIRTYFRNMVVCDLKGISWSTANTAPYGVAVYA